MRSETRVGRTASAALCLALTAVVAGCAAMTRPTAGRTSAPGGGRPTAGYASSAGRPASSAPGITTAGSPGAAASAGGRAVSVTPARPPSLTALIAAALQNEMPGDFALQTVSFDPADDSLSIVRKDTSLGPEEALNRARLLAGLASLKALQSGRVAIVIVRTLCPAYDEESKPGWIEISHTRSTLGRKVAALKAKKKALTAEDFEPADGVAMSSELREEF